MNNTVNMNESRYSTKKMLRKIKVDLGVMICVIGGFSGIALISDNIKPDIEYREENNKRVIDETLSYEELSKYEVITVVNENNTKDYYIGKYKILSEKVFNLLNEEEYAVDNAQIYSDKYVEDVEELSNYLYTLDEVKDEYTPEEIENIYEEILEFKNQKNDVKTLTR